MYRKLAVFISAALILVGAELAFDDRFVPLVALKNRPLFVVLIYFPTVFFAVFTLFKLRRGRVWPLTAFAIGLIGTGLFHQMVAEESYGNPGYMIPGGHVAAPVVSLTAYLAAFLGLWAVVRAVERAKGSRENEGNDAVGESPRTDE